MRKKYRFYGKCSGFVLGVILTGNIVGGVLGSMLGHFLFDYKETKHNIFIETEIIEDHAPSYKANLLQSLLNICIFIIDIKRSVLFAEINLIKEFLIEQFSFDINEIMLIDKNIINIINNKETIDIRESCKAANAGCKYDDKLNIIRLLFMICNQEGEPGDEEIKHIAFIADMLYLKKSDYEILFDRFCKSDNSYYKTLGIEENSTLPEIKSAYRKLVSIYHPDKAGKEYDREKFQKIVEAYNSLIKNRSVSG